MIYREIGTRQEINFNNVLWIRHFNIVEGDRSEIPAIKYVASYICEQCGRSFAREEESYPLDKVECDYPDCSKKTDFLTKLFKKVAGKSVQGLGKLEQVEFDVWI
jgi:DNA-directed RNA polymerase subunit RPC12/RpoP